MKKPSLSKRIQNYLQKMNCYVNSGEIERLALQAGFKSSNAGRRYREMVTGKLSDGKTCPIVLERKEDEKGIVWYKYKTEDKPQIKKPKVVLVEENGIMVARLLVT